MKRIGIMGGTFDPLHKGHIEVAKSAMQQYDLDKIIFIPSGHPPHKKESEVTNKEHRYKMVKIAIKGMPHVSISRIEVDRKGYSYAIDTFEELKKEIGEEARLFYIMGIDSINEILSWKKPLELFKMCEFIVATRPKSSLRTFKRLMKFPPLQLHLDKIHVMEIKVNISATELRERLKHGKSVSKLIPRKVLTYIKENNLYK